ncbi:ABC transporter substrate-binding protein [Paenibacillus sp. TRM 82003]|nr:ABC transporter substrate-binding protein [Paenibacillus sp. TRM 82003]
MFTQKIRWNKWAAGAMAVVTAITLSACGGGAQGGTQGAADSGAAAQEEPIKLRLGYLNVMDDAQTILAHKADLYAKHGLDVEMTMFDSGTKLIQAIVGGQLDAGVLGFTNALSWLDKGADLKIVGGAQRGFHGMLVHQDSGIEDVAALNGKSVASQTQGSTADIVLNGVVFEQAGLKREDLAMQYVSPAVAIQSLAAEKVDGAFVFEPYSSIAQLTMPVKQIYEIGEQWPFPCMVVISSGDLANNNKTAVEKMLNAQKEAIDMLENDPAQAATFITDEFIKEDTLTKLDGTTVAAEEVIEASIASQTFNWEITEQDIQRMDEVAQMMVDQGILEKKIDVNTALDLSWQQSQQ